MKTILLRDGMCLLLFCVFGSLFITCIAVQTSTCELEEFSCGDGQCIQDSWKCDGLEDCDTGADEKNCNVTCGEDFTCKHQFECISESFHCDGYADCTDGSDENDCGSKECKEGEFRCQDSTRCIDLNWKCDGDPDCNDESDEGDHCNYTCRNDQFKCANTTNYCISKVFQCDHSSDCPDGSDEFNCTNNKVCDRVNDCQHKEDEETSICKHKNPCAQKKCGEHSHCLNQVMAHNKMEAVCTCDSGFEFHEVDQICKYVNECEEFGRCSQICNNTKGGYKCLCKPGYTLEKHYFCRADGDHSWLYYTNGRDIRRLRTDSRYMEVIVEETTNSLALGIDYEHGLIFWTDGAEEIIKSAKINSQTDLATDIKTVVQSDGNQAFDANGIAVDWLYKNIYWTDAGSDKIKVSDYEGKNVKTLVNTQMDEPRAICLDPENGYMYWSDWGKVPKIERSSMDGTKRETIVRQSDGLERPSGLTIDYVGKRIYWVDSKLHNIGSASLDGSDFKHILVDPREIQRPVSISVFEDSLYWADRHTNSIRSVNKFTGHNPQTLSLRSYSVMDITVYQEKRQTTDFAATATTLCSQKKCEHLCLPVAHKNTTAAHEVVCACRDGSEINSDQRTCTISATSPVAPTTPVKNTTAQAPKPTQKPKPTQNPTTVSPEEITQKGGYAVAPEETTQKGEYTSVTENRAEYNVAGNQDKHNNAGVIAFSASAVVLFILIAVFVVAFLIYRRHRARNKKRMNLNNAVYGRTSTTEEQCMITQDDALSPQTQLLTLHHENV